MKIKSKINPWLVSSVILILLLVVSILTGGFGLKNNLSQEPEEEIAKKAIDFINKNFLSNGITASLVSISPGDTGLYKVKFKIKDQEFESYVSSNGNMIFPQGMKMETQAAASKDQNDQNQKPKEIPKKDTPDVKLFVMAFCPYGNQAEEIMMPVVDLLKNKVDIELHYIVSKDGNNYQSLHGDQELHQDIREICVREYQKDKLWDFVKEINSKTTPEDVDTKWEKIAQNIGINIDKVKECQKNEGSALLDKEIQLTDKYKVTGSPTLMINETIYQGDRTPDAFKKAICSGFKVSPEECNTKLPDTVNASDGGC